MAKVAEVEGVEIRFYWNEHPPPHFHAVLAEYAAVIDIGRVAIVGGSLPRPKLRAVLAWAGRHQAELLSAWQATRSKRKPGRIE